jgi:hypothetical protein
MASQKTKKSSKPKAPAAHPVAKSRVPTSKEVASLLGVELTPPLQSTQIQRMRNALPGYAGLLDDAAALLEQDADELDLPDITPQMLLDAQFEQKRLAAREAVVYAVYRSLYQQRMQVDDRAMKMLERLTRRIKALSGENPELPVRWKLLLDFIGTFRQGGRRTPPPEAPPPAPVA